MTDQIIMYLTMILNKYKYHKEIYILRIEINVIGEDNKKKRH